jgi:hypothetical protein
LSTLELTSSQLLPEPRAVKLPRERHPISSPNVKECLSEYAQAPAISSRAAEETAELKAARERGFDGRQGMPRRYLAGAHRHSRAEIVYFMLRSPMLASSRIDGPGRRQQPACSSKLQVRFIQLVGCVVLAKSRRRAQTSCVTLR